MRNVLFVDDEAHVLDGLRDLLRRQRREWRMVFALGAEAALQELESTDFDVVVSDMRMPGMDGASLLRIVQERYPRTVRIILSGQTELQSAVRAVPVAHQFLTKPCDPDQLRRTIERACVSQALLANEVVRNAAGGVEALPSAPTLYLELNRLLDDPDASVEAVGALVESDVAMCAKVLQLVNSSFFGLGRHVASAREAVVYLGIAPLRALVVSAGAFRAFETAEAPGGFSVDGLKTHSALVARTAAHVIADRKASEDAFTAGMLHDVGKLVLSAQRPEDVEAWTAEALASGRPLDHVEHERLGATHAEVGAYLLTLWGLPYEIVEAVAHHHAPARVVHERLDVVTAVHVADALVNEQQAAAGIPVCGERSADLELLDGLGVAGELDAWRRVAAEQYATAQEAAAA